MGIYHISAGSAGGACEYNSILRNYQVPVIPGTGSEKVQSDQPSELAERVPAAVISETSAALTSEQEIAPQGGRPEEDIGPEDLSLTFNIQEDFEYIGRESDIHSLDVEKAIDEMKRDKVLQQYQYFVESSRSYGQRS